jgi:hypothetical protein
MRKSRCLEIFAGSIAVIVAIAMVMISGKQDPYKE